MFSLIFSFLFSTQVNGINVEKCSHEEVVSIWVSFIRVLETTLIQNQSDSTEALDPYLLPVRPQLYLIESE